MSRFNSDDYDEMFPNQGALWHANVRRAIKGRHGQRDLRTLEAALLEMPRKRLIEGRLAKDDEVCAVAAFAVKRRVEQGEDRASILAELANKIEVFCDHCYHGEADHHDATCEGCEASARRWLEHNPGLALPAYFRCDGFVGGHTEDNGLDTAEAGKRAGMTFVLAWRIGQLNDEDFEGLSPEARYEAVLAWVREKIIPGPVAT